MRRGGAARETKTKPAVAERLLSLRVQALSIRSSAVILPLPCSLSLSLSRSLFRRLLTFGFSGGIKQENPRKKQAGGSSSLPLILLIRAPADTEEPMVMVKEKVAHPQEPNHPPGKLVIQCYKCGQPCKGEVLRVQSKHFHIKCFTCKVCGCDLAQGGFFMKNGEYLCTLDYQRLHGTRCNGCGDFVEGEVVTALGKTYHPTCFVCTVCKRPFPAGDRVTFNGKDCLCQRCIQPTSPTPKDIGASSNCAGCGRDIKNGQALLALDSQWHLGCFKCKACGKVLSGEYISKDGSPYCENDYQIHFGVQCEACHQFITGKVLEAGDKHYHPSCARCSRCNQMFTEGEEMYLQGSTVWHPDCKNNSRVEEKYRPTRSSSESICSRPGSSIPGSPGHTIYAKVDNEIIDYKDLAAIPRVKAIYDIERPDMISYESLHSTSSTLERQGRHSPGEPVKASGGSPPRGRATVSVSRIEIRLLT
uniref:Actin binding LIM protein 1b n=1 Tax=Cyprinus carpio TaxID=7962 RepID=A0A8C2C390_CYPCA